ncbi:MAG: phenylalanine--tRNA ligase subunit alpha [candidate division Zixibacteria bacterium]|nr:phenylalanine--tRNA ligase subunit alpha [candidate division Zixibacteria bacterium]
MSFQEQLTQIKNEALERIGKTDSLEALKDIQVKYLGRKGAITAILKGLKDLSVDQRKEIGGLANRIKTELEAILKEAQEKTALSGEKELFDPTLPGTNPPLGRVHIVNQVLDDICHIFHGMGFEIARGPNVETDYYNFGALNFAPDHPARDMRDTFFVENDLLLRTHTTSVQARYIENHKPPIKIITPGLCFRNEAISTRSHVAFHQVDGFLIDEGVSMADLKGVLSAFCKTFFGEQTKMKWRPSYFPFTEPSMEVDVSCFLCGGKGCRVCKQSGWLEILGCGMIHPNVLKAGDIDPEKYTGYAFGIGVERPAMLKYRIDDIRLFFNNDVRFLRQFG